MDTGEYDPRARTVKAAADVSTNAFARIVGSAVANYIVSTTAFAPRAETVKGVRYANTIGVALLVRSVRAAVYANIIVRGPSAEIVRAQATVSTNGTVVSAQLATRVGTCGIRLRIESARH